ncbi:hypothetical protein ASPWEDRAFT_42052 [Aspergillus wentii DTO 134E9]|uniref:Annexin n=1 Tax=Aspergillus wentii DTO 134E9 TaxID=1073089 RepID=A0A1L9RGT5_ASPWE|nr:uncharacterized protein ASPWEDRAFT_42052 [Aspergillus wentii DTO 134E9]KAI9927912.1 hypothetical protein MW887_002764 [Aspergillus wentii]OJJ34135.1 hypothetical protein ASPWEDRAFT_42052 [Aspergillus wentii DTO 134E9]
MSLQVNDPRSRGRSKSPGGRSRDRSRSRSQVPSPAPESRRRRTNKKYSDSESAGENLRSASRNPRSRGSRSNARYDVSSEESEDSEDDHRDRHRHRRDRYAHSDVGEEDLKSPAPKYSGTAGYDSRSHRRHPSQYDRDRYSSDSDSSADDDLAYGDLPGKREKHYRLSSGGSKLAGLFKRGSSRPTEEAPPEVPGSHPGYARHHPFKYADPVQSPHAELGVLQPNWPPIPECEMPGFVPPSSQAEAQTMPGAFPSVTVSGQPGVSAASAPVYAVPQYMNVSQHPNNPYAPRPLSIPTTVAYAPAVSSPNHQRHSSSDSPIHPAYANPPAFQYAQIDPSLRYATSKPAGKPHTHSSSAQLSRPSTTEAGQPHQEVRYTTQPESSRPPPLPSRDQQHFVEIAPGNRTHGRSHSHSVSSANNLTVAVPDPSHRPSSPLLEPYTGTYQSISPMPSPIIAAPRLDDELSDLEPLDAPSDMDRGLMKHIRKRSKDDREHKERRSERSKRDSSRVRHERHGSHDPESLILISPSSGRKRVSFYDPAPDAIAMQEALSHTRNIDTKTLIRILPHLDSDEVLDLRKEYKNHVKLHGKGINVAKHIRLKLGNSTFGKVCYVTALGRFESEAYWANCYYQSSTSRRELLIESLMGRTNMEIREIKEDFRDSRYMDDLEKCMKAELKADKFRVAVLLALEGRRQSEREPVNPDLVQRDVQDLYRALMSREGGETAMIHTIVRRSDSHLREVLRVYERIYKHNFAKAMIAKSRNLVGETLAHILNGAINRPMRDALLLHQALRESRSGKERSELLISRLVRLHWEPRHLERVKSEFRKRYRERLEEAIAVEVLGTTGGSEWGEFCIELARSSSVRKA